MSGGAIIIQRAKALLMALTEPCVYETLSEADKITVNTIDAKDPMSRTQQDINILYGLLGIVRC